MTLKSGKTASGTYRVGLNGADVTLDAVSDTCEPRRMLLDRSRWRPAGTAERPPVRKHRRDTRLATATYSSHGT